MIGLYQFSTYTFITSLCNRLSHPGLASRAQTLFSQAMSKGQFRWGRKAKLTAGASVSIAVRESRKSVSLRDISVSFRFSDLPPYCQRATDCVTPFLRYS